MNNKVASVITESYLIPKQTVLVKLYPEGMKFYTGKIKTFFTTVLLKTFFKKLAKIKMPKRSNYVRPFGIVNIPANPVNTAKLDRKNLTAFV